MLKWIKGQEGDRITKVKTVEWFKKHTDCKKVIVYQNLKCFLIPSLHYEYVNPTHKTLVTGIKKRKYRHGVCNEEKIAMLLRNYYPMYLLSLYIVFGWLVFCKL